ncbi:MAG: hypothetical protein J6D06_07600 [Clostridia bacterium]|nr:hypothetical protein [Clostridia bacterium]
MFNNSNTATKRIIPFITAICCVFSVFIFSSCDISKKPSALTINGTEISDDVLAYFIDCAINDLGENAVYDAVSERACALAGKYYKTNSLAHGYGLALSTAQKVAVSEKVNAYWNIYSEYYSTIGITKETLTKVFSADAYRDLLLNYYYGEGGVNEIPLSRIYANFRTNYIVFQAITGYFTQTDTAGNNVRISQNEIETLVLKFQNMSQMVNSGEQTMEEACQYLSESGYPSSVQTVILHKDDTSYPPGFFEKVQTIETHKVSIIGSNDYIFLVLRGEIDSNSSYFLDKKTDIIREIVGTDIDKLIEDAYELNYNLDNTAASSYYSVIIQEKGGLK